MLTALQAAVPSEGGILLADVISMLSVDIKALDGLDGQMPHVDATSECCKDFCRSRLLPSKYGGKLKNPRPGFKGEHGQVVLQCLLVTSWVMEFNPNCEVFCENIRFDDLKEDWQTMSKALGEPLVRDAADFSCTRRVRAYWTNISFPSYEEMTKGFSPVPGNLFMGVGRKLEPYVVDGKTTVRTIGASWMGDPDFPKADTSIPVVVHDDRYKQPQHLVAEEAEPLLGFQPGATAGNGVSQKDRLTALGDGWDVRTTMMQQVQQV